MMVISCIILSATLYTLFETDDEKSIRVIGKQNHRPFGRKILTFHLLSMPALGLLCCCLAVLFFASPLTMLAHVIRTQNTDSLPFPIIVASFFVCLLWTAYGVLIGDRFIQVRKARWLANDGRSSLNYATVIVYSISFQIPNLLGGILAGIQLTLYVIYPKKKASFSGGPRYSPLVSENPILQYSYGIGKLGKHGPVRIVNIIWINAPVNTIQLLK